jgi:hypothetical protein
MASLMNGLSSLGSGVAQYAGTAGLEAQKAALAQQQAVLADQLATTRETGLQQSAGQIAAAAATQQQGATAALATQAQTAAAANVATEQAGATSRTAAEQAGATQRAGMQINAPPDVIKILRALHAIPDDGAAPPAATTPTGTSAPPAPNGASGPSPPLGSSAATPNGSASPSPSSGDAPSTSGATPKSPAGTASGAPASPMDNPLVRKALGFPVEGSEEAIRYAIAQDVKTDPIFRYASAGQQGAEVQNRFEIASGKLMDPNARGAMAAGIASYQIPPITGRSLLAPGASDAMAQAMKINPDYRASIYNMANKAMSDFGTGPQGDKVRFLDTATQHLAVLGQAADALNNGNVKAFAALGNQINQQTGNPAPTTFDGLKQIVATEVEKSIAGGIGASSDREQLMESLSRANSPAQLTSMLNGYRSLMAGQLSGLKQQYETSTGIKTGPFAFETKLTPETLATLKPGTSAPSSKASTAAPAAAAIPSWVKPGDQYSPSRGMARGADGTVYGAPQ